MAISENFSVKTLDIALRIGAACAHPHSRPAFLHWSDGAVLGMVAERLLELEAQVERQQHALEMALKLALKKG